MLYVVYNIYTVNHNERWQYICYRNLKSLMDFNNFYISGNRHKYSL